MTRFHSPAALLLAILPISTATAQVSTEKCLSTMKVAEGFQVELFASEPMVINPTSIDIDPRGRVWVCEAVNYRRKNFGRPILRNEGDRIVVLVDKDDDGKADESVVFYQGTDLYGPIGICIAPYADGKGYKVFVCQSPDILVFEDKDGDLKADGPPKKFLSGFGGFDHDHGVHGINIGPDGKLYFTVGDAGVTGLQSSDDKGRLWKSNGTDCRAGTVWRCDMDGTNLELIAHNFRNNYECCVDSFGEIWLSDNDDDGNQQTRICFVMPGGNYGYNPRGPGQSHWHEEQPGIVHKVLRTGFGSPTGITFYEGNLFPEKYRGNLLHCDAGPREVRAFFRKPKGAGYELEKEVLLTSSDNWFRPSDVCVAPDGSAFVADWYDPGVGGHGMGDWTRGRIYRLTPKGHKGYKVPEVKPDTKEGLIDAFASSCLATRAMAQSQLRTIERKEALWILGASQNLASIAIQTKARIYASWAGTTIRDSNLTGLEDLQDYIKLDDKLCPELLQLLYIRLRDDFSYNISKGEQKVINESLKKHGQDIVTEIALTNAMERELVILLRKIDNYEAVRPPFYALAKLYDGHDIFYRAALNIACGTDPKRRDAILADFDNHFPEWNDKVADLVWELQPKSVLPRLGKLLADAKLTATQKARIVEILAASDDPSAGKAMLVVLQSDAAAEVKSRAIDQLRQFLPTKWKSLQASSELTTAIDSLLASEKTISTALQLIAAVSATGKLDAVVKIVGDSTMSLETRKDAIRTLGRMPGEPTVSKLAEMIAPENPLAITAVQSLGELLPRGQKPPAYSTHALMLLTTAFASDKSSPEVRSACLAALAANRAGTIWLLEAQAKKSIPTAIVPEASQLVRNSPYPDLRNRALLAYPAPGKLDPKKLPAIAELAKRSGSPERGRQVWAASNTSAAQCAKCHMVRGIGGQVGPDLSMIGKKGSKENLFESILMPSKAIADQYIQQSITTTAGITISGLVVADSPAGITLRDANGKNTVISRGDIESQKKLAISIMPEDVVAALDQDELIDLVAYLQTLQTAALTPDSFKIVGPFKGENMSAALAREFGPEKGSFDAQAKFKAANNDISWRTITSDGKGYFDLAALHGDSGTSSASYMAIEIESPEDQAAELQLGTDDGTKLWVNGAMIFTHEKSLAAAPAQDIVPVKLKKGVNSILLKVANGNNPHGFYFTILSGIELKAK